MDGTIANLYGVDNWLADLQNGNDRPYKKATPMVNMNILAKRLNKLHNIGYKIGIVSWLSKNSTIEYDEKVTKKIKEKNQYPLLNPKPNLLPVSMNGFLLIYILYSLMKFIL